MPGGRAGSAAAGWRGHDGVGARLIHRGQRPLHVVIGEGAGQSSVLPFADGRHGALDAGRNHAVSGQEAKKRRVAVAGLRQDDE